MATRRNHTLRTQPSTTLRFRKIDEIHVLRFHHGALAVQVVCFLVVGVPGHKGCFDNTGAEEGGLRSAYFCADW